jgi:hypothetical protein
MKQIALLACVPMGIFAIACGGPDDGGAGGTDVTVVEEDIDVAAPGGSAGQSAVVETCLELAKNREWAAALDPCTQAARELPDNLEIQNAMQQAQAAAEDSARAAAEGALDNM